MSVIVNVRRVILFPGVDICVDTVVSLVLEATLLLKHTDKLQVRLDSLDLCGVVQERLLLYLSCRLFQSVAIPCHQCHAFLFSLHLAYVLIEASTNPQYDLQ